MIIIIPCNLHVRETPGLFTKFSFVLFMRIFLTMCLLKRKKKIKEEVLVSRLILFQHCRNHSSIYHWHFWMYILYQWWADQHQGGAASQPSWLENQLGMQAFAVKSCFKPDLLETHNRIFFLFLYLLLTAGGLKLPELSSLIITLEKRKCTWPGNFISISKISFSCCF